jgi:hypothetical protein
MTTLLKEVSAFFSYIYSTVTGGVQKFSSIFILQPMSGWVGILAEGIVGLFWLITHLPPVYEILHEQAWGSVIFILVNVGFVAVGVYKAISAIMEVAEAVANGAKSAELGFWAVVIVTGLLILANFAILIYMVATGHEITGVDIGLMFANLFASIIVVIIFAIVSSIPVFGYLIVALYNLVQTILKEIIGTNFTEMLMAVG